MPKIHHDQQRTKHASLLWAFFLQDSGCYLIYIRWELVTCNDLPDTYLPSLAFWLERDGSGCKTVQVGLLHLCSCLRLSCTWGFWMHSLLFSRGHFRLSDSFFDPCDTVVIRHANSARVVVVCYWPCVVVDIYLSKYVPLQQTGYSILAHYLPELSDELSELS